MKDYGLLSHLPLYPIYPIINSGQDGLSEREKKVQKVGVSAIWKFWKMVDRIFLDNQKSKTDSKIIINGGGNLNIESNTRNWLWESDFFIFRRKEMISGIWEWGQTEDNP